MLLPPFYTDFGKSIRVGRNVFINHACEFMDRGGITIEDDVLVTEDGRRVLSAAVPKTVADVEALRG